MRYRLVVFFLVVVGLAVCWGVYTVTANQAKKTVAQKYEERQKSTDEINKFLDEQNKPSRK